jgi:hypothetical protein
MRGAWGSEKVKISIASKGKAYQAQLRKLQ